MNDQSKIDDFIKKLPKWMQTKHLWVYSRGFVSRGVAAGLLVCFIPMPIQTILAILSAILLRGNVVVACAMTWISNPLTFIPINLTLYKVGSFILDDHTPLPEIESFHVHGYNILTYAKQFIDWLEHLGKPILVGLPIVSLAAALFGFLFTYCFYGIIKPTNR